MNDEQIEQEAEKIAADFSENLVTKNYMEQTIRAFGIRVRDEERERYAQKCEAQAVYGDARDNQPSFDKGYAVGALACAAAIRAEETQ